MNPTHLSRECEWPVRSLFFRESARACARPGHGDYVRLCSQHYEAAWARLINDLYTRPNAAMSKHLADWFMSVAPSKYDSPEAAEERAESRRYALIAISRAFDYAATDDLPTVMSARLQEIVDEQIAQRLAERWSA